MVNVYKDKHFPGSAPASDSNEYPDVDGINYENLVLTSDGVSWQKRTKAIEQFEQYIKTQQKNFLGYQASQAVSYSQTLSKFLDVHVNNIGDPFQSGNFTVNSKIIERAVLDYFASLWNAKWPHIERTDETAAADEWKERYWGYLLSMGSSEGNIYALWNARDYLSGKYLLVDEAEVAEETEENDSSESQASHDYRRHRYTHHRHHRRYRWFSAKAPDNQKNAYTPIAFYSGNTHYSIIKNMRILGISTFYDEAMKIGEPCPLKKKDLPTGFSSKYIGKNGWPYDVPSNEDGTVHIRSLRKLVKYFARRGYPTLISFNYGSTFKGALDDVKGAIDELDEIFREYNMYSRKVEYGKDSAGNPLYDERTAFWIHVDGALGAGYVPFLRKVRKRENKPDTCPVFDFSIPQLHSMTMSGHKWIGAPWPCGIFMSKGKYQLLPVNNPVYLGSSDSTFSGSRNGFSALVLWDYISRHSVDDLTDKVQKALELVEYFKERFTEVVRAHDIPLWLEHSPNAITIRFRRANDRIVQKYSLSNESLYVKDEQRDYSHIFIMGQVTKELLDDLIEDLKVGDAFKRKDTNLKGSFANTAIDETVDMGIREIMGLGLGFK